MAVDAPVEEHDVVAFDFDDLLRLVVANVQSLSSEVCLKNVGSDGWKLLGLFLISCSLVRWRLRYFLCSFWQMILLPIMYSLFILLTIDKIYSHLTLLSPKMIRID